MKWFLVDDCTTKKGAIYTSEMKATTREEAERELEAEWNELTEYDKTRRDEFYAVYGDDPFEAHDVIERTEQ